MVKSLWGKQIKHVDRRNSYTTHWDVLVAAPYRNMKVAMMMVLYHVKERPKDSGTVTIRFSDPEEMAQHFEALAKAAREGKEVFEANF